MRLLIIGCGYVGTQVARNYLARGDRVLALTRTTVRAAQLREAGIECVIGHWLDPDLELVQLTQDVDQVLVAVPHRDDQGLAASTHQTGLANLFRALSSNWQRLIYLSTTGVYGESDAQWVDEQTLPVPSRLAGEIALRAERWFSDCDRSADCVTLRLAGIYGQNRVPHLVSLRSGNAVAVPQDGFLNLIHVDDISRAIQAVFGRPAKRPCYVLSDGHPVARAEFYREIARLGELGEITFAPPDPNSPRASRAATNKRIRPANFFADFEFQPRFRSFREGLGDCFRAEGPISG